jgi:intracellular sulfur oxidation DsrE/DsrF family protein
MWRQIKVFFTSAPGTGARRRAGLMLVPLALLTLTLPGCARADTQFDDVLAFEDAPPGVVFEIATGGDDALEAILPPVQTMISRLRMRFADMPIAVVTHGREQFALQTTQQQREPKVHSITRALRDEGVTVHVCGTFAGWRGLGAEDFPDYVDVSAAGPAQVNDYRALDFVVIKITGPPR